MDKEKREAYTEVLEIIKYVEKKYKEKIPKKLILFLERNCSKKYIFNVDLNVPLKEQKLKEDTKALLAMINIKYWCDTEEEKRELIKKYYKNENMNNK